MSFDIKTLDCIQCNKCTFHCPVHRVDVKASPRKVILERFFGAQNYSEGDVWSCLTCGECGDSCPSKVDFPELVKSLRRESFGKPREFPCKHGNMMDILQRLMQNKNLKQDRNYWVEYKSQISDISEYVFFTGCIPYLNGIFDYTDSLEIGKSALKLFNKAGIKPIVSEEERCCGHNLLWNGDMEGFKKLGEMNYELFKKLKAKGAKKIVATCAECYRTLKYDYPEHLGELPLEVIHMSQFIKEMVDAGKLKFKELKSDVTYQDPCRLGRHSKLFDEPRDVLKSIPGLKLNEMDRIRGESCCCGVGAYANCNSFTKFIQNDRLNEAKSKANVIVTSCPHCRIHFSCYLSGEPIEKLEDLDIVDLTILAAKALEEG